MPPGCLTAPRALLRVSRTVRLSYGVVRPPTESSPRSGPSNPVSAIREGPRDETSLAVLGFVLTSSQTLRGRKALSHRGRWSRSEPGRRGSLWQRPDVLTLALHRRAKIGITHDVVAVQDAAR